MGRACGGWGGWGVDRCGSSSFHSEGEEVTLVWTVVSSVMDSWVGVSRRLHGCTGPQQLGSEPGLSLAGGPALTVTHVEKLISLRKFSLKKRVMG